jgi:drug/metabolite transporter (DMT)-like permease
MWILLSVATLAFWGTFQFLIKVSQTKIDPVSTAFLIYFSATAAISIKIFYDFFAAGKTLPISFSLIWPAILGGIFVGAGNLCTGMALKIAPGSKVFPIINLALIVSTILSILFFKEAINFKTFLGIIFAIASIFLITAK